VRVGVAGDWAKGEKRRGSEVLTVEEMLLRLKIEKVLVDLEQEGLPRRCGHQAQREGLVGYSLSILRWGGVGTCGLEEQGRGREVEPSW